MVESRPTLKQIADIAGVSITTVSYVLTGKKKVSEKTRTRVISIMKELNYAPNLFAQNLRTNNSKLIFALTSTFSSVFNGEILGNIETEFEKYGYQLLALSSLAPSIISSNIFDGGIILNYAMTQDEIKIISDTIHHKMVMLSGDGLKNYINVVSMDNDSGIKQMLIEISKSVHNRLCFIQGSKSSLNNQERYSSAKKYYQQYFHLDDFEIRVFDGNFETLTAYNLALKLIKSKQYNAFICFNDAMALGVYQAAAELGVVVGKDISLIGFDNIFWTKHLTPKLTTINIDKKLWAQKIVESYLSISEQNTYFPNIVKIPTTLVQRESIAYKNS